MNRLEWQVAGGSRTAHVIDTVAYRTYGRMGPRSICGRYPQRSNHPWFSLDVQSDFLTGPVRTFQLRVCEDCKDKLDALNQQIGLAETGTVAKRAMDDDRAWEQELLRKVAAVRDLHVPLVREREPVPHCWECGHRYPCATIRALEPPKTSNQQGGEQP